MEPLTKWNPKHTLEFHDQQKVMNYIHNYRAYQADDGIRTFRQNITDIAMYGIKASLTHIKCIADWPKDDDEEIIAAILFHYGGSNVAQRMPAAEIFNRFAVKRTNDKYNHSDVLKLQAHTAQAIHEYPVSMAAVGVEAQINLFVMNFRHPYISNTILNLV